MRGVRKSCKLGPPKEAICQPSKHRLTVSAATVRSFERCEVLHSTFQRPIDSLNVSLTSRFEGDLVRIWCV